jgi:hypothetical protein
MKSHPFTVVFLLLLVQLSMSGEIAAAQPPALRIGAAAVDITPPVGYRMSGGYGEAISTGVNDPLFAKALVLRQAGAAAALVICDLTGISRELTEQLRAKAGRECGIPVANIAVTATHTHGGPLYYDVQRVVFHRRAVAEHGKDPHDSPGYLDRLVRGCVQAVVRANRSARPARVQAAVLHQPELAFNRRYHMRDGTVQFNPGKKNPNVLRPAGPTDDDLPVLLFRDAGTDRPFASLTVFAMHVAVYGGPHFGADFPGHLQKELREHFGNKKFISLFGEGAAGDVNHINVRSATPDPRPAQVGARLATTIAAAGAKFRTLKTPRLAVATATVQAPLREVTAEELARAKRLWHTGTVGRLAFLEQVESYRHLLVSDLRRRHGDRLPMEVQGFRLDADTAVILLPHEVFVELGLAIRKASPFARTLVVTLANDQDFYVPTRKAFGEGSYEVTNSPLKRGGGEILVKGAVRALQKLKRLR